MISLLPSTAGWNQGEHLHKPYGWTKIMFETKQIKPVRNRNDLNSKLNVLRLSLFFMRGSVPLRVVDSCEGVGVVGAGRDEGSAKSVSLSYP